VVTWLNASFEMRFRIIGGLTVRFAVSEDHSDHALLLSPWPESLLAFEPLWWSLTKRAHLVAVDLPGFGHSQRSDSLTSPRAMGEFIITVADAFGLNHPHLVATRPRSRSGSAGWSRTSLKPLIWTRSAAPTRGSW
jgi:pimeloyl-ACP methyl ester carboxylesterase